jgi:hypothetical protein
LGRDELTRAKKSAAKHQTTFNGCVIQKYLKILHACSKLALGGTSEPNNLPIFCGPDHRFKTTQSDIPRIAKTKRLKAKHLGACSPAYWLVSGSKSSSWTRKMNGTVVKNISKFKNKFRNDHISDPQFVFARLSFIYLVSASDFRYVSGNNQT